MGLVERERRLVQIDPDLLDGKAPEPLDALAELLAAEQLHHQEGLARGLVDPGVEDVDDELALDVGRDLGLAHEALAQIRAVVAQEDVRVHDLERAAPLRLEVHHLVDLAHAALSEAALDPVTVCENGACREPR